MTTRDLPPQQHLVAFRGDTWRKPMDFTLTGDISTCTLFLTIKRFLSDPDSAALVRLKTGDTTQGSITPTSATSADFVINAAVMATLPGKTLRYDVQAVLPNGDVCTAAWGTFLVTLDVTLATS